MADAATDDKAVCNKYFRQFAGGEALGYVVSFFITFVNVIIRAFVIWMIKKVGYHTLTAEISAIMVTIYVMTFFNTGVLLLLADANFT